MYDYEFDAQCKFIQVTCSFENYGIKNKLFQQELLIVVFEMKILSNRIT